MNDSSIPSTSLLPPVQVGDKDKAASSQVTLSAELSQRIKERLKKLKEETRGVYTYGNFLALVIEDYWEAKLERLRTNLEKGRKKQS